MKKQYFKNFRKEGLPGGPNELIINSEGFILSENGQWEFPGLPTVIPSSDITMEDVPYPVLGISDTGDTQMMYPEEDYQFDGDMVYELPMAQKGYNVKPRKGSILLEGETEPSTHLMRREYIPNTGWVAFPSLFQNEDGTWVDMSKEEDWMNIYDEANRRGEVYNFGENKRKAIKFADKGSWKKDLGIKKQGGGDISIPDLTKPNWLNNLPKAQPGGTREPIYVDPNDLLGMQRYNAYNDSLNLYKAYQMQDKLMGPGSRVVRYGVFPDEWSIKELLDNRKKKYNSHLRGFFAHDWQSEEDMRRDFPIGDEQNSFDLIKYYKALGFTDKDIMYHTSPDIVSDKIRPIGTYMDGSFNSPIYKKPVQPYAIRKTEPRTPYSPVQTNPNSTVQLPINNIPLQQIPTIGIGEPTFEGNNAYWKKQDNQLIYQNNDYSNNRNLPISNKPGDRFHQEPSWMVGDDRYYERDGEAYLVPQPKGGWKNKQILDPSSGKWKSKIVKKANGGWLDKLQDGGNTLYYSRKPIEGKQDPYQLMQFIKSYIGPNDLDIQERPYKKPIPSYKDLYKDIYYDLYPDQIKGDKKVQNGGSAKLLNRSRKEIIKQRELEENLRKEGFNEDGVFTRVLPEYTVKSPEKKLYDEAFQDVLNKQKSFQNKWYPGDISEGVLDNMKQRANVIASDKVAKNILENNKVKDLKDYQKEYIANSNYSGKLRPGIFKEFTEGVQDLGRITQGKLPTTKALGILSPLEYPVNLVRGTVKGEGLDALKGKISSPWIDASKVDIGAVNDVGAYNTIYNIGLDPLNLTGIGLTGAADDVLKGISKGSKYFKTNKIVNTPKQLPNPSLGEPLGTVEDVANRSAIQYAGSEPYLFNPETNTWEILRNEINDKYRQGYTDIPQFNEQLKEIKATTEFGKRPLLNKADFYTLNEIEDKTNQQINYYNLLENYEKANPQNPSNMILGAFTGDQSYMNTFHNLHPNAKLPDWGEKFFLPTDYKIIEENLPYQYKIKNPLSKTRLNILNNGMDKILPSAKPLAKGDDWFYTAKPKDYVMEMRGSLNLSIADVNKMNDFELDKAAKTIFNKLNNQKKQSYLKDIEKKYTGVDAFQQIQPNKLGGQKKGWLDKL